MDHLSDLFKLIPSVNECLTVLAREQETREIPLDRLKYGTRLFLAQLREMIASELANKTSLNDRSSLFRDLVSSVCRYHRSRFVRVVNGTGVIIHTNLGRSILPETAVDRLVDAGGRYSNLEFDLISGKRGSRYVVVDELLCELTGAEASLVVNNNAAAVLIALDTLARKKQVVVSRGQLVEIGGSFRIPDIMERSGAHLVEVGTTNRTHYQDYENAINDETALLLRVHCSNYRIIGFTSEVSSADLVRLGKEKNLPVMEDLGSGCMVDLSPFGLAGEPTVQDAVKSGIDIITFSGDKLLGGPQAGILVGKKQSIDQIRRNPLNRALRIDKLTLASLESVLRLYLDRDKALLEIPTLAMIAEPQTSVAIRAEKLLQQMRERLPESWAMELVPVKSQVGGGALPEKTIASWAVAVKPGAIQVHRLERLLRQAPVPVIARLEDDRLLLDMRTIANDELTLVADSLVFALDADK